MVLMCKGDPAVVEIAPQTSDISSLEDFSDEAHMSPINNARKRKRPLDTPSPQPMLHVIPAMSDYQANGRIIEEQGRALSRNFKPGGDELAVEQHRSSSLDIDDLSETAASKTSPHKRLKSKRKGRKSDNDTMNIPATLTTEITAIMETKPSVEAENTSHEDFGIDDPMGGAEIETSAKTEEGRKSQAPPASQLAMPAIFILVLTFRSREEENRVRRLERHRAVFRKSQGEVRTSDIVVSHL